MKDLYDITESILDDEDDILDAADAAAEAAADRIAAVEWLKNHGVKFRLDDALKGQKTRWYNPDTNTFSLDSTTLTLDKKDKNVPQCIHIDFCENVNLHGYMGDVLPDFLKELQDMNVLSIRNCPNLKSLRGCPHYARVFAVSGCPKVTSLDGCPAKVKEMFKFINNGASFNAKQIKRYCNVDKKDVIHDITK